MMSDFGESSLDIVWSTIILYCRAYVQITFGVYNPVRDRIIVCNSKNNVRRII